MYARNHITPDSALGGWQMKRSLRWEGTTGGTYSYLYRTGSSPTGGGKYSYSSWIKRVSRDAQTCLWGAGGGSQTNTHAEGIYITSSNQIALIYRGAVGSGSVGWYAYSKNLIRDYGSWYHIMLTYDNNQSGIANKIKYYFNGVEVPYYSGVGSPGDLEYVNKSGVTQYMGRMDQGGGPGAARVYQAETHVADGYIWTPSDFGYTDAQTGQWRPKRPQDISVDYGNNGFYLDYADNTSTSTIGIDRSGNSNNWTASGFSVSAGENNDSLLDTPTNNFATFNPLIKSNNTFSDGNLKVTCSSSSPAAFHSTLGASSGKYYMEFLVKSVSNYPIGISGSTYHPTYYSNSDQIGFWLDDEMTRVFRNGSNITGNSEVVGNFETGVEGTSTSWSVDDIAGLALDMDKKLIYLYKGSTQVGYVDFSGFNYEKVFFGGGNYISGQVYIGNFGQRPFAHTPPAGYRSLCSRNLATPLAAGVVNPKRNFAVINYSGNASTNKITGLEFKPDCVWTKVTNATGQYSIFDSVRGATKRLGNGANGFGNGAETTVASSLQSFDENGFTFGNEAGNNNGENYTAWCWKAGGTAVSNSDGSITTSVSVNKDAGFSIITYTGTGSNATVGHGLGVTPKFFIIKRRDGTGDFAVYHEPSNSTGQMQLSQTNAQSNEPWFNGDPTSSVINLKTSGTVNGSSGTYVIYCWAEIPGYSKFGSYVGNGDNDGTFVDLGFKPAFVILKRLANESWIFADIKRTTNELQPIDYYLLSTSNAAQSTGIVYDFLSNGIKFRSNSQNENGSTYIYMAWAEEPSGTGFGLDANCR